MVHFGLHIFDDVKNCKQLLEKHSDVLQKKDFLKLRRKLGNICGVTDF